MNGDEAVASVSCLSKVTVSTFDQTYQQLRIPYTETQLEYQVRIKQVAGFALHYF